VRRRIGIPRFISIVGRLRAELLRAHVIDAQGRRKLNPSPIDQQSSYSDRTGATFPSRSARPVFSVTLVALAIVSPVRVMAETRQTFADRFAEGEIRDATLVPTPPSTVMG
jgi:hypothetical protein